MRSVAHASVAVGDSALKVDRLHKAFGGVRAVWDVSFSVRRGQTVGLIGPNGSGKTTLLNLVAGHYRPDAGAVWSEGENLAGLSPQRIARKGVIRTWQDPRIIPEMTVAENVAIGRLARGLRAKNEVVEHLLDSVGLLPQAGVIAAALPYGQQKLLALSRSLAAEPAILLLDEPLAGLSAVERELVIRLIEGFRQTGTVLLVDHAFGVVAQLCDHVVVLNSGAKLTEGIPGTIARDPAVIEVYFG
jgi:ABC-type branched-subunit amino acid transport system ATPase component